jgi:hypothetical protein
MGTNQAAQDDPGSPTHTLIAKSITLTTALASICGQGVPVLHPNPGRLKASCE